MRVKCKYLLILLKFLCDLQVLEFKDFKDSARIMNFPIDRIHIHRALQARNRLSCRKSSSRDRIVRISMALMHVYK